MEVLTAVVNFLSEAIKYVVLLLPDSPFVFLEESSFIPEQVRAVLPALNWVFGISSIVGILELWLTAVAVYYVYQAILRWIKAIE